MRRAALVLVVVMVSAAAQASTIEETTGIDYQWDGSTHGDASDTCAEPQPVLPVGNETAGLLVPGDDPEDDYGLSVTDEEVGITVTVTLTPGPSLEWAVQEPAPDYDLRVWTPGCGDVVGASHDNGTSVDEVAFEPGEAGTYTIQVLPGKSIQPELPGPIPMGCHGMCVGTLNGAAGYNLTNTN